MVRGIKVSIRLATASKHTALRALIREVRGCTNRYINSLWDKPGGLDAVTLNRVRGGSLSYRHRSNCLKVAIEMLHETRAAAKALGVPNGRPYVRNAVCLSSLVAKVEPGKGSFDYVLKVSGLKKGKPIVIPFRGHKRLNHWLGKPGAKLLQGCVLGDGWAMVWIRIPDENPKESGKPLAVDVGKNKLLVDSDGKQYGLRTKELCAKVARCKPGSQGKRRARTTLRCYINHEVKLLPWDEISVLGVENLKGMKNGKKKNRSKKFRKANAPWTYRHALDRIEQTAQENRVRLVKVDPRNTSRTCPKCGWVSSENRRGEHFVCVRCHYTADADFVGASNVLVRTLGNSQESMVPASPREETG